MTEIRITHRFSELTANPDLTGPATVRNIRDGEMVVVPIQDLFALVDALKRHAKEPTP